MDKPQKKLPYFPFYPDDWISSHKVMMMTMEQRGIYITLLAHAWKFEGCALPNSYELLQRLCPGAKRKNIEHVIDVGFTLMDCSGLLAWTNPRLLHERSRCLAKQETISGAAKLRENKKRQSTIVPPPEQKAGDNQILYPEPDPYKEEYRERNVCSKRKVFTPPTAEEVKAYCQERGNSIDPEYFVNSNAAKGWVIGKHKVPAKDWRAMVRTWEKTEKEYGNGRAGKHQTGNHQTGTAGSCGNPGPYSQLRPGDGCIVDGIEYRIGPGGERIPV